MTVLPLCSDISTTRAFLETGVVIGGRVGCRTQREQMRQNVLSAMHAERWTKSRGNQGTSIYRMTKFRKSVGLRVLCLRLPVRAPRESSGSQHSTRQPTMDIVQLTVNPTLEAGCAHPIGNIRREVSAQPQLSHAIDRPAVTPCRLIYKATN